MSFLKLTTNEMKRLIGSPVACLFALLTVAAPLTGLWGGFHMLSSANGSTLLAMTQWGALLGSALYTLLAVFEMDRIYKYDMVPILEARVDMMMLNAARVLCLSGMALIATLLAAGLYLPLTAFRLKQLFDIKLYCFSYFMIMLPAMLFAIFFASGVYMICRRKDLTLLICVALSFISLNAPDNYLVPWIQTNLPGYSDYFGNALPMRTVLWNRLVWLALSLSLLLFGLLFTRTKQQSAFRSAFLRSRGVLLPASAVAFLVGAYLLYVYEPYFDRSPDIYYETVTDKETNTVMVRSVVWGPDIYDNVHVSGINGTIEIDAANACLSGKSTYEVINSSRMPQNITLNIQSGYTLSEAMTNGIPAPFEVVGREEGNAQTIQLKLPADENIQLVLTYGGHVKQYQLFHGLLSGDVISRDYINLSGDALIPQLNVDSEGCVVAGTIAAPKGLTLITGGEKTRRFGEDDKKGLDLWQFSLKPSRAQVLSLVGGRYNCMEFVAGGMDIQFFYSPLHEDVIQRLDAGGMIREAIDYFTEAYGPLDISGVPLKIVESSVFLSGGVVFGNICSFGESVLSEERFIDDYSGTNGAEVLVHEICHQWWGVGCYVDNTVMPWSPEGLAVFSTYKFLQHKFGDDYAQAHCVEHWKDGYAQLQRDFYYRNPEYLNVLPEHYLSTVMSPQNSIVMYAQMALHLLKAEEILGEEPLQAVLSRLYKRYKNGLTYEDFLKECRLEKEDIALGHR